MHIVLELSTDIPDQPSRWHLHHDLDLSILLLVAQNLGLPLHHLLRHHSNVLARHVDRHLLDRLVDHLGRSMFLEQGGGRRHGEFESLSPKGFEEDTQVKDSSTSDLDGLSRLEVLDDLESDVGFGFLVETFLDHSGGEFGTFLAGEGRVVGGDEHGDGGRVERSGL